jgi:thioesterase domain-containing protein
MAGRLPEGPVVVSGHEGHCMATLMAEALRAAGRTVTLVSESGSVAPRGDNTAEGTRTRRRRVAGG